MTIEEILAGESKNVEFKVQRPDKSTKYMKTVVAFANGKGGQIVFGIDDKTREVVGIPEDKVFQEIDAITNAISDSCEPTIIPDVNLQNINDKPVIVAEIFKGVYIFIRTRIEQSGRRSDALRKKIGVILLIIGKT